MNNLSFHCYSLCADGLWRRLADFGKTKGGIVILVRGKNWKLLRTEKP